MSDNNRPTYTSDKGNNDLGKIEDMLIQLLGEVDVLKAQTAQGGGGTQDPSFENVEPEVPFEQDRGYEPEGHAGTSTASHASQSGHQLPLCSVAPSTNDCSVQHGCSFTQY